MNIQQALNVQNRTVSYRDAEVLLAAVLKKDRTWLYAHSESELSHSDAEKYETYLIAREGNQPVAYITGVKEFYGRPFSIDARALIPRPETEGVIDHAMAFLPKQFMAHLKATNKPCALKILELGTGCGNIAVTLAAELGKHPVAADIIATDVAPEALELAQENYKKLGESNKNIRLEFLEASLFDHKKIQGSEPFDLIVANLPYVPTTWKIDPAAQPDVIFHEPDVALFGGEDGLDIYREFFQKAPEYLAESGQIIIEYGETQTKELLPLARAAFPTKKADVYQDYAGLDRVLVLS
jgi:release factor glutamine methyltransferase